MSSQHLSDEAVAAFADGVLSGHARERAGRHAAGCPECSRAVRVQREAVLALRAAPAPALPLGLLDRLRSVPVTTELDVVPSAMSHDGAAMFAAFGSVSAAFVAPVRTPGTTQGASPTARSEPGAQEHRGTRLRPIVMTAAAVAAAGVFAVGSAAQASVSQPARGRPSPAGAQELVQVSPQSNPFTVGPIRIGP